MYFIGITGGVGAGKSAILQYLAKRADTKVVLADLLAKALMKKGSEVYDRILAAFPELSLCGSDGELDSKVLADEVFGNDEGRERINAIVHPAVKDTVLRLKEEFAADGIGFFFLEAALLIEEGYGSICDELWYVFTDEATRRARLKENRGYSDARVDEIFAAQRSEEEYRRHCARVIDNNGTVEEVLRRTDEVIEDFLRENIRKG